MKYVLSVLFALAVLFGSANHAQAQNFHVQVLDPNICGAHPADCVNITDAVEDNPSSPLHISLAALTCQQAGVPNLPSSGTYGCVVLNNVSGEDITSINLTFDGLAGLTFACDTAIPGSIFTQSTCSSSGGGFDTFSFYGGTLPSCDTEDVDGGEGSATISSCEAVIYEHGVDPSLFQDGGVAVNAPVPEPDSLLLFGTGAMMAALYMAKRQRLFAFGRK